MVLCAVLLAATAQDTRELRIRAHGAAPVTLHVELAVTEAARRKGLSGRDSLAPDGGMLFVYARAQRVCIWMKDTRFPLALAFVRIEGGGMRVVETARMRANTTDPRCSSGPVDGALEAQPVWLETVLVPGSVLEF